MQAGSRGVAGGRGRDGLGFMRADRRGAGGARPALQDGEVAGGAGEGPLGAAVVAEHGGEARQAAAAGRRHALQRGDDGGFQPLGPFGQPQGLGHLPA